MDAALWDLKAKLLEVPLCTLLGRVRKSVPIYGSGDFTTYSLEELKQQGTELKRLPDEVLAALRQQSALVLGELAAQNELNGRIWASMQAFQAQVAPLHEVTEKELFNWR